MASVDQERLDELYENELRRLGELCRDFVEARARQERRTTDYTRPQTPDERFEQLLLCGMVTTQCAKVYNLSPQAGLLDPRTLFTGRPE